MQKRCAFMVCLIVGTILSLATPTLADDRVVIIDGQTGPGSLYRLALPANTWNGTLVLYAHGFVGPDEPIGFPPDVAQAIALLTDQGFAVAASSFSENGWGVKDGAQRTHQLLGLFTSKFGSPTRVYMVGGSMGGLIAIDLMESYPNQFAGLLAACPVSGGLRRELDYFANVRVLFDFFYPGVLPGSAVNVPPGLNVNSQIIQPATLAMLGNPNGAQAIASIAQTPVPFASGPELIQSIVEALVSAANYPSMLALTHGQPFFDNSGTVYTTSLPPFLLDIDALNQHVQRFSASPAGLNYVDHNYTPTGELHAPALTLSTFRDPLAPRDVNALAYDATVTAAGSGGWLVQRQVAGTNKDYGHCTFSDAELGKAFTDLVGWAEFGIKPAQ